MFVPAGMNENRFSFQLSSLKKGRADHTGGLIRTKHDTRKIGEGCKIELSDPGQLEALMDAAAYDEFAQQAG